MIRSAPRLETERLILRSFERSDLDAHAATLSDPEVARFLGGNVFSREDSCRRMMAGTGCWAVLGYGVWAVEFKDDGRMVGHCGFFDYQRDMEPRAPALPEMGWIFDPAVHGKGIAREACAAALDWADATIDAPACWAMIDPQNDASIRLALRLDFEQGQSAIYHGEPISLFHRTFKAS